MSAILSFRLKLTGTDKFRGVHAVSTSFRVHGLLRLVGDLLIIQWGGVVQVQDVSPTSIRDNREILPEEGATIPVSQLYRATLAGGWWRPRLTLQAKELGALGDVPGEESGTVHFWYARRDRTPALAMARALNDAIAAAALPAITP